VKQISPVAFFSVVLVVLVIVGAIAFSVWKAPSSTVDKTAIASTSANPRAGGAPTAEDFRKRDEYNKTHPGSSGSR